MPNNPIHTFVILAYKESPHLDDCIKSVLNQTSRSAVVIATTTKNNHISSLAKKYRLPVIVGTHTNIGGDFDFAISCGKTALVTVAHQDDIYDRTFAEAVIAAYNKHPNSSIIFTDYYEIRENRKVHTNTNLKIKRFLLLPIRLKRSLKSKFSKRTLLRFGDPICCPAVTFATANCKAKIFSSSFQCNVDWHAWEKLSKSPSAFTFVPKQLMGHRISEETTTSEIIKNGIRTKEDYQILCRFWPRPIAKLIARLYQKSEKSNSLA